MDIRIFRMLFLFTCCACFIKCSVNKHVIGVKDVSIVKELKDKKRLVHEPEKSAVSFHFTDGKNIQIMNQGSIVSINHIEFLSKTDEDFGIELLPGKYNIQCKFIGYNTSKLRLMIEKEYDYKINIKFNQNMTIKLQ
ncbi:MAG: hypothetical protein H0X33_13530 [Taibaiella sp.]|nr:hypothetical protein [Taibaiella sp.]